MSYLNGENWNAALPRSAVLVEQFGFVPRFFRALALIPRLADGIIDLVSAILFASGSLSRRPKDLILLVIAARAGNHYWYAAQYQILSVMGMAESQLDRIAADHRRAGLPPDTVALLDFASDLTKRKSTFDDGYLLEAVATAALARFLIVLSTGLGIAPDFKRSAPAPNTFLLSDLSPADGGRPHVAGLGELPPEVTEPLEASFGFVPNIFRSQSLRPAFASAAAEFARVLLTHEDLLTRVQKQFLMLGVSASQLDRHGVALHSECLFRSGASTGVIQQVIQDHRKAGMSEPDRALLDFALELTCQPAAFGSDSVERLRQNGFRNEQILEAIVTVAFARFLGTLHTGLSAPPDFALPAAIETALGKMTHPLASQQRHNQAEPIDDPDGEMVAEAQNGNLDAFEQLMHKHGQRVYRTLVGILGDREEARDAMQETFLKAFQHLAGFQRRARFSTWLLSIAGNTGVERLRERKPIESLDYDAPDSEGYRPRQVQSWTDNPEQLYSKSEMRALVENRIMGLPAKYRVVLLLRDVEELSTLDAAAALGLAVPALKARLLRGRLMLREALAPHFAKARGATP